MQTYFWEMRIHNGKNKIKTETILFLTVGTAIQVQIQDNCLPIDKQKLKISENH